MVLLLALVVVTEDMMGEGSFWLCNIYILTVSHTQYISVQDPAYAPHYLMRAVGFLRNTDFARCLFTQWLEDKIRLVGLSFSEEIKKKRLLGLCYVYKMTILTFLLFLYLALPVRCKQGGWKRCCLKADFTWVSRSKGTLIPNTSFYPQISQ